jgi:hypothetical protein
VTGYVASVEPILNLFVDLNKNHRSNSDSQDNEDLIKAQQMLQDTQKLVPPPLYVAFHLFLINREEAFIDWMTHRSRSEPDFTENVMTEWSLINNYCHLR